MTPEEQKALEDCAEKIIEFANKQQNPKQAIAQLLANISVNAMGEEREAWESATSVLGVKTKEKLLRERYKDECQDHK